MHGREELYYKTKSNPHLQVDVKYNSTNSSFNISDYITISGLSGVKTYVSNVHSLTVYLDDKTPFMISVKKCMARILIKNQ